MVKTDKLSVFTKESVRKLFGLHVMEKCLVHGDTAGEHDKNIKK